MGVRVSHSKASSTPSGARHSDGLDTSCSTMSGSADLDGLGQDGAVLANYFLHSNRIFLTVWSLSCGGAQGLRSHAVDAALALGGGEVDVVAHLALSGAMHPGQIVLTGLAFTHYQEQPISVCDVFDLGDYHIAPLDTVVRLTEVLPARLHGRAFPALRAPPGLVRQRKGYHEAPATAKPVCICFCQVPTPAVRIPLTSRAPRCARRAPVPNAACGVQAVKAAEQTLMQLWQQNQLADQRAAADTGDLTMSDFSGLLTEQWAAPPPLDGGHGRRRRRAPSWLGRLVSSQPLDDTTLPPQRPTLSLRALGRALVAPPVAWLGTVRQPVLATMSLGGKGHDTMVTRGSSSDAQPAHGQPHGGGTSGSMLSALQSQEGGEKTVQYPSDAYRVSSACAIKERPTPTTTIGHE